MKKTFTKILSVVLCAVMVLGAAPLGGLVGLDLPGLFVFKAEAATYSGKCGTNLTWSLDTNTGVLNITGTGAMTNYSSSSSIPWYSYRSNIKTVNIASGVTRIGNYAFSNCDSLTSVTIGNSVTTIGDWAFCDCYNLTSVTIPDSVTTIGDYAFCGCDLLTSVTIPDSVTSIGELAFASCTSLTSITIPDSVTFIGNWAFDSCNSLTSITIPDSVTSIGNATFQFCDNLTDVTIPDSVTSIGDWAFNYCDSLTRVTIPESVTTIGDYAFYNCDSLTDVYYTGTEAQWKKISIGSDNDPLKNATIHYNSAGGISESVKIMSYNIYVKDGTVTDLTNGKKYDCSYENRVRYIVQNVHANMPDSFGVQEISKELRNLFETYEDLNGGIITANYTGVGDYRGVQKDTQNEASLIYYNHYKYTLEKSGTIWLSESGEKYSRHSKAGYLRVFTYALLKNKETGYTYLHINTHMDHNDEAAQFSADKIISFINNNFADYPVVITGDFNQKNDTATYKKFINAGYSDARSVYAGNTITYTNPFNQGENGEPYAAKTIDHIFVNEYFDVVTYEVYDEDYRNSSKYGEFALDYPYPSDHHPIVSVINGASPKNKYNIGEETYSFENFCDDDSPIGHCFGMAVTSAGYYLNLLNVNDVGLSSSDQINTLNYNDTVKKPICYYQAIQGSYKEKSYATQLTWSEAVNYVKNHNFDNSGSLAVDLWVWDEDAEEWYGHAVNFLYYTNVNGQDRIYVYDNNFPDTETYLYKDSSGNICQLPLSIFSESIDEIYIIDMQKYFNAAKSYRSNRVIYSEGSSILVNGVTGTPMSGSVNGSTRYMFEIPTDKEEVIITPLVENAEFTYMENSFSFEGTDDGEIGILKLASTNNPESNDAEFNVADISKLLPLSIVAPSTTAINYGETLVLQLEDVELPEGWRVEWSIIGNAVTMSVSDDGKECRVTSTASGNVSVTATLVDENGEPVTNTNGGEIFTDINVKSNAGFWQKIVSFFKNLFRINRIIY